MGVYLSPLGIPPQERLVLDALNMAIHNRRPAAGLVHHSDRGSRADSIGRSNTPSFGGVEWDDRRVGVQR